jgi:hypothetical protein
VLSLTTLPLFTQVPRRPILGSSTLRTAFATMSANAPVGSVGNGGVALSPNRDEGTARFFDDLAIGLESNAISRAKLIKLGGTALAASALGLFASAGPVEAETPEAETPEAETPEAETLEAQTLEAARRRHHTQDCCISFKRREIVGVPVLLPRCLVCCRRRRRVACCGRHGCHCCRRGHCHEGRCRRAH